MKLYNDFYTSDMIVASPLGLITVSNLVARQNYYGLLVGSLYSTNNLNFVFSRKNYITR